MGYREEEMGKRRISADTVFFIQDPFDRHTAIIQALSCTQPIDSSRVYLLIHT